MKRRHERTRRPRGPHNRRWRGRGDSRTPFGTLGLAYTLMNRKSQPPNENQRAWNQTYTQGMRKSAMRQARQIATQRNFTYQRIGPICLQCGGPRDITIGLHCSLCKEAA